MSDEHLNPFDDELLSFHVLRNEAGFYSLWPSVAAIPGGWSAQFGPETRQACLDFIDENWRDAPGRKPVQPLNTAITPHLSGEHA